MTVVYTRNRVPTTEIVRLDNCPATSRNAADSSFPPDFDPSKIKRRKGMKKDPQMTVRLMSPYSMRCKHCGEYICEYACGYDGHVQPLTTDKGKKFNARKETAVGEEYLGIKVFRFYIVSS